MSTPEKDEEEQSQDPNLAFNQNLAADHERGFRTVARVPRLYPTTNPSCKTTHSPRDLLVK